MQALLVFIRGKENMQTMDCEAQLARTQTGKWNVGGFGWKLFGGRCPGGLSWTSGFPCRNAGLQVSMGSGYDLCHPVNTQTGSFWLLLAQAAALNTISEQLCHVQANGTVGLQFTNMLKHEHFLFHLSSYALDSNHAFVIKDKLRCRKSTDVLNTAPTPHKKLNLTHWHVWAQKLRTKGIIFTLWSSPCQRASYQV